MLARDAFEILSQRLKLLGKQYDLPLVAMDILLLIGRKNGLKTAADIIKLRGYKANLVSMHVERLVQMDCLKRVPDPTDRRRITLELGPAAEPIVRAGHALATDFHQQLLAGVSEEQLEHFRQMLVIMRGNLDAMQGGK